MLYNFLDGESKKWLSQQQIRKSETHTEIPSGKVEIWMENSDVGAFYLYKESLSFMKAKDCAYSPLLV